MSESSSNVCTLSSYDNNCEVTPTIARPSREVACPGQAVFLQSFVPMRVSQGHMRGRTRLRDNTACRGLARLASVA